MKSGRGGITIKLNTNKAQVPSATPTAAKSADVDPEVVLQSKLAARDYIQKRYIGSSGTVGGEQKLAPKKKKKKKKPAAVSQGKFMIVDEDVRVQAPVTNQKKQEDAAEKDEEAYEPDGTLFHCFFFF